jgi:RNA polymerase sigma-70 factor (ECF subfamily)
MAKSESDDELLVLASQGNQTALAELFSQHRDRLWRLVTFRMDPRLHGRVDADDVLQEAWLSAVQRLDSFLIDASRSLFVWFRLITCQTLVDIHRRHLGAQKRNAGQEFSIDQGWAVSSTSSSLSFHLMDHLTTPSEAALRQEMTQKLHSALNDMRDLDREVLALRHFEQLTNRESAQVLGISEQAASDRYVRALTKLRGLMQPNPGQM